MIVNLAYGVDGFKVNLPNSTDVLEPSYLPGLKNIQDELVRSLRFPIHSKPLQDLVLPKSKVVIVHTDLTRATPNQIILPPILKELELAGVSRENISLITGLGTHRPQTEKEIRVLLGDFIVDNYACLQHDAEDRKNLKSIRSDSGNTIEINRVYLEADIRILTGLIEPHFFAGFSGGPKSVLPAIAGKDSIHANHGPGMLSHPKATWGITQGNPIWEQIYQAAKQTSPTFILNVSLNTGHDITGVFAGDLTEAHKQGCSFVKKSAMVEVHQPYDIVVTTNSGYPLDQNLYQSVKGICAAENIIKHGGAIIIATACLKGLPEGGFYAKLLSEFASIPEASDWLSQCRDTVQEQWQVQKQINVQQKVDVYVYSDGLTDDQIRGALFKPCHNIELAVEKQLMTRGDQTRICVLPQGPLTVPYLNRD